MKPNFALSLSFEGIGLLHRAFPGWNRVGEVALDSPDLGGALAVLRETAEQIAGPGFTTKLVIPNDQIKYLALDLGPMVEEDRSSAIRSALEGATPYPVDELKFDWSVEGERTLVAAVARETLAEAEDFALSHGFAPLSFVAIPPDGQFSGEPFFGQTRHAESRLTEGEKVQRDMAAIRVTGVARLPDPSDEDAAEAENAPDAHAPDISDTPDDSDQETPQDESHEADAADAAPVSAVADAKDEQPEPAPDPTPDDTAPKPAPAAEPVFGHGATTPETDSEPHGAAESEPEPSTPIPAATLPPEDTAPAPPDDDDADEDTPSAPAFASMRAHHDDDAGSSAPSLSGVRRDGPDLTAPSIPIAMGDEDETAVEHPATPIIPTAPPPGEGGAFDDIPPMPAYLDTRTGGKPALSDTDARPPRLTVPDRYRSDTDADSTEPDLRAESDRADERQRMTVFGARQADRPGREIGGKPRHLGLILSLVLLLFLAGVAAWASLFMDQSISRLFSRTPETEIVMLPPDAPDETAAEGEEAMVPTPPGEAETAALAPQPQPPSQPDAATALPEPLQPGLPHALTRKEAQARYAVTGVWQRAPLAPQLPDQLSLDDLYVASIDPRVDAQDAVALPPAASLDTDAALQDAPNTATRGARFRFDDRGLVVASADGTLSPDGFLVYAGRPAQVPAALPRRLTGAVDAPALDDAARQRLATIRPKSRPNGLIEQNERETLGGLTRTELAAKRPKARPALPAQKIEEETQQAGTEFAVAQSRKPRPRPSNFATLVERARKTEQTTEPQATAQIAAAVPRAQVTAPAAPSRANVAKAATVRNQLNLRKVNLIGVYGKPSSRRALVRLANGRYKKVKVGDRLDGGRVDAIGEQELRYTKNGRNVTLRMPKG